MTKPWIQDSQPQRNSTQPGVSDLYKSPDVFINGVPAVLYAQPQSSEQTGTADAVAFNMDDAFTVDGSPEEIAAFEQTMVASGIWSQADVDAANAEIASPSSAFDTSIPDPRAGNNLDYERFRNKENFPDSFVLTPKGTTLGQMRNVALTSYKIVPMHGLTESQIVYNLAGVAHNIWEPIKDKYSDAFITSSFRSNSRTQHGRGQAIDIQFRGLKASEYFNRARWIRDNLPFDQLLLECRTGGSLWIHCSYYAGFGICIQRTRPGSRVMTFINDKPAGVGLRDLSTVPGVRNIPAA